MFHCLRCAKKGGGSDEGRAPDRRWRPGGTAWRAQGAGQAGRGKVQRRARQKDIRRVGQDQRVDDAAGFAIQSRMVLPFDRPIAKVAQRAARLDKGDERRILLHLRGRPMGERQAGKGQQQQEGQAGPKRGYARNGGHAP